MAFKLADRETIIATHAEHATGPGWSNDWVNVIVYDAGSVRVRQVGLQWSEMNDEMRHLFKVCSAANKEMLGAVMRLAEKEGEMEYLACSKCGQAIDGEQYCGDCESHYCVRIVTLAEQLRERESECEKLRSGPPGPRATCTDCERPMVWSYSETVSPTWMCPRCTLLRARLAETALAKAMKENELLRDYARADAYCPCCGTKEGDHLEDCDHETARMQDARAVLASGTGNAEKKEGGE